MQIYLWNACKSIRLYVFSLDAVYASIYIHLDWNRKYHTESKQREDKENCLFWHAHNTSVNPAVYFKI